MKPIHLIPLTSSSNGDLGFDRLEQLAVHLARTFRTPCRIRPETLDIAFAWDDRRQQYYSTAILGRLERVADPDARVIAVTSCDLFVPVLTFVFGEAQLDGNCAVVSSARLHDEFYGMPHSEPLFRERAPLKEAVHELGHTFGLRHCPDWRCVMTSSHAVERLDVKTAEFCRACRQPISQTIW